MKPESLLTLIETFLESGQPDWRDRWMQGRTHAYRLVREALIDGGDWERFGAQWARRVEQVAPWRLA